MLLLKRHLVALVRAGKKRQTIRLWTRSMLRAGQISYTPGLGKMLITSVDELPGLDALTEADAVADGFKNLAELLAEIRRIYGAGIPKGRSVFRIKFQWPADAQGRAEKARHETQNTKHEIQNTKHKTPRPARAPATKIPAAKKIHSQGHMNPAEREQLRAFLVSMAPEART